jgi:hypothetical protein
MSLVSNIVALVIIGEMLKCNNDTLSEAPEDDEAGDAGAESMISLARFRRGGRLSMMSPI